VIERTLAPGGRAGLLISWKENGGGHKRIPSSKRIYFISNVDRMKEEKKHINLPFFLYVLFERVRVYIYFALRILPEKRSIGFFGKIIRERTC
jgi:hypothetical protein